MNAFDKHALLVNSLLELEEADVLAQVRALLQAGDDPFAIIEAAEQALRLVGERYEQGDYFISSMMMAGEIFREVMELVAPVLAQQKKSYESGQVLLGTTQGDIHDIGKNIFGMLLRSHGFTVIDLGVDVSSDQFTEAALQHHPDIIAISGLLTISYESMKEIIHKIKHMEDRSLASTPVIIGGGTMNATACAFVGADYWATDAMVGVRLCRQIIAERKAH